MIDIKNINIFKDIIVPLLIAIIPVSPDIYKYLTASNVHFVYNIKNKENPVQEWNKHISKLFTRVDFKSFEENSEIPNFLLKRIGKEIYESMPAMIAGIGLRPNESSTVQVMNVSGDDLKNIKVHFEGCEGYSDYETWPDALGSNLNPKKSEKEHLGKVTVRYDKLAPSTEKVASTANLTFYGDETKDCKPIVEAELSDGKRAIGIKQDLQQYLNDDARARNSHEKKINLFFKLFFSAIAIYLFLRIKHLEKKLP